MPYLSQNFLIDHKIRDRILEIVKSSSNDTILEIGPGKGILSHALKKLCNHLILVELDSTLYERLLKEGFTVYHKDILQFDLGQISSVKIVANIPYHITKEILLKIVDNSSRVYEAILMVQLEVAEKLSASLPTSFFAALIMSYYEVTYCFTVPKSCFSPAPKVDSAIMRLLRKEPPPEGFKDYLKQAFQGKRKQLYKVLKASYKEATLQKSYASLHLEKVARAQELTIKQHKALYLELESQEKSSLS